MTTSSANISPLWQLRNVSVDKRLCDVSVEIPCGVTAILGVSGAGKSTLLDLLAGTIQPTEGTVSMRDAVENTDASLPLFSAGSGDGLWPHLTAAKQIAAVGAEPGDWLPRFELSERSDVQPPRLSQGERSRLEFARALAADPTILLMDEPLTHVDRRRSMFGWRSLQQWIEQEGRSLVFSTHDLDAAARLADHVVCLVGGRVADAGPWDRVRNEPACEDVAWLVGGDPS